MKVVRVKFSGAVFSSFFEKSERAFGVDKGLPEGARLVSLIFPTRGPVKDQGIATFEHESFENVIDLREAPEIEVNYTAYAIEKGQGVTKQ